MTQEEIRNRIDEIIDEIGELVESASKFDKAYYSPYIKLVIKLLDEKSELEAQLQK